MKTENIKISAILKALRQKLDLTQEELAEKLGVNWVTVSRWENDHNTPHQIVIRRIKEWCEQADLTGEDVENSKLNFKATPKDIKNSLEEIKSLCKEIKKLLQK